MRAGPLRIRDIARSKGERRRQHRGHKPANILSPRARAVKVVRMYEALCESGWKFRFKAEAVSPRGFTYTAEGDTAEEAFLKAFGQWRDELYVAPIKIPKVKVKKVSRPYRRRSLDVRTKDKAEYQRQYMRQYMRQYRAEIAVAA